MENQQNQNAPKLFTVNDIAIASFFGGIFAGGYMFYKNFKTLGQEKYAKNTIWISIYSLIAVGIAAIFLPDRYSPAMLFAVIFAIISYRLFKSYQKKSSIEYRANVNNKTTHWTKTLGIIILTTILQSAFLFALTIVVGMGLATMGIDILA